MFEYSRDGDAVLGELAAALEAAGWPVERRDAAVVTRHGELEVVATADAGTVVVDVITDAPPADARPPRPPPLTEAPADYPAGFPFIPGGIPGSIRGAPAGSIGLIYPGKTAAALSAALRKGAERRRWMCTQEPRHFVCAAQKRSVDVRLREGGGEVELLLIAP